MTNRHVAAAMIAGLVLFVTLSTAAGATATAPGAPVMVNHTYIGDDADAEHAYQVTVTVAPTRESGAVNDTLLTVAANEAAFIDSESVSTSQTTNGSQVITRVATQPVKFRFDRIEPGETASVSFRLYPKAALPRDETLATVNVKTQFVQTKRVVTETRKISPTLQRSEAQFATAPPVPPLVSGGAGAGIALILAGITASLWRRRLYRSLRGSLKSARTQTVSTEAEREVAAALRQVGGASASEEDSGVADSEPEDDDLAGLSIDVEE